MLASDTMFLDTESYFSERSPCTWSSGVLRKSQNLPRMGPIQDGDAKAGWWQLGAKVLAE